MEKKCSKCNKPKPIDQFNFRNKKNGTRHPHCKLCWNASNKLRYQQNKQYYIDKASRAKEKYAKEVRGKLADHFESHPCVDCEESDIVVLQFDHVRGKKKAAVATLVTHGYPWKVIAKEIKKCEIRCANCHIRRTAKDRGFWSIDY